MYVLSVIAAVGFQFLSIFVPIAHGVAAGWATLYALCSRARGRPYSPRLAPLLTSAWGALAGFMVYAIQLPQLIRYSHDAPEHMPMSWALFGNLVQYLAGGSSVTLSCLVVLCAAYGWTRRYKDSGLLISLAFPGVFIIVAFTLTRTPGSPRLFSVLILPVLMGIVLFVHGALEGGTVLSKVISASVIALLVAGPVPLFRRYYALGNPPLRQLGAWVGDRRIWLAGSQSDVNRYYFSNSASLGSESDALASIAQAPDYVLVSVAYIDLHRPLRLENAGFRRIQELAAWNEGATCYVLLRRL